MPSGHAQQSDDEHRPAKEMKARRHKRVRRPAAARVSSAQNRIPHARRGSAPFWALRAGRTRRAIRAARAFMRRGRGARAEAQRRQKREHHQLRLHARILNPSGLAGDKKADRAWPSTSLPTPRETVFRGGSARPGDDGTARGAAAHFGFSRGAGPTKLHVFLHGSARQTRVWRLRRDESHRLRDEPIHPGTPNRRREALLWLEVISPLAAGTACGRS